MKKLLSLLVILIVLCSFVFAKGTRVAVVFATGGLGDKSFNDAAMKGLVLAKKELGIKYDFGEPSAIADYETYLTQFANTRKYDLIISIGFDQADALGKVADRYKKQNFAIVDMVVDKPNVASYIYKEQERGFLIGYASALTTVKKGIAQINSDKVIGVIGGMKIPLIDANIAGFIAGAEYANNGTKAIHSYVGSWVDPAKGKELTISMFERGADIVWGAAGRSGIGVINAAKEENKFAIGADSDQSFLAPKNVLTNGMKNVDKTLLLAIKSVDEGKFQSGLHFLGIAEDALGYSKNLLPKDVIQSLENVKKEISAGKIEIPNTVE